MLRSQQWHPDQLQASLRHPILSVLYQRLIFAGQDADGGVLRTFRPAEDGGCVTAQNDPVDIHDFYPGCVTHRVFLSQPEIDAWRHLEDYKLIALLSQLD